MSTSEESEEKDENDKTNSAPKEETDSEDESKENQTEVEEKTDTPEKKTGTDDANVDDYSEAAKVIRERKANADADVSG